MTTGLAPERVALPDIGSAPGPAAPRSAASGDGAEVNSAALVALSTSLTVQSRADVSDSLLFGQLAANKAVDRFADPAAWAAKLFHTLSDVGWTLIKQQTINDGAYPPPLHWREIVESRFRQAYGAPAPLVELAIAAAGRVSNDSPAAELWSRQTYAGDSGLFGIAFADADGAGDPRLALLWTAFTLKTRSSLILDWGPAAEIKGGFVRLVMNTGVYSTIREQIISKLGNRITTEIRTVPLSRQASGK
jgi:hypothetical protein